MGALDDWNAKTIETDHGASMLDKAGCVSGLCAPESMATMLQPLKQGEATMSKPLPRLPDTRIVNIATKELPGWARELDIDPTGLDEATLRLRLKEECDRLFPIVYADFIKAYNEFIREHGFPLAEWGHI